MLIFSFVLEMWTLWVAYKAVKTSADALNMTFGEYLKEGPDPMAVAVLLEDAAAVTGVMLAGASIGLFILTGNPIWGMRSAPSSSPFSWVWSPSS